MGVVCISRDDRLGNSGSHPNWQQRQANRQRYERLVSRFFEDQQQRIRDIVGIGKEEGRAFLILEGLQLDLEPWCWACCLIL